MAKQRKPKLIPLRELRPLCKEAGVELEPSLYNQCRENVRRGKYYLGSFERRLPACRVHLKAFCLGLIAMKKAGEL